MPPDAEMGGIVPAALPTPLSLAKSERHGPAGNAPKNRTMAGMGGREEGEGETAHSIGSQNQHTRSVLASATLPIKHPLPVASQRRKGTYLLAKPSTATHTPTLIRLTCVHKTLCITPSRRGLLLCTHSGTATHVNPRSPAFPSRLARVLHASLRSPWGRRGFAQEP